MGHHGYFCTAEVVFMRKILTTTAFAALLGLAGCAGLIRTPPAIGDSIATVQAKFGTPTAVYPAASGQVLEYATGPMGQYTWMARIGPDGRLASFDQVLNGRTFATIKIGVATKDDVLRTIGRPAETSYLGIPDLE